MSRETLLLVEKSSHCFSFYDLASGERTHSVALPDYPHEFVVDAAQRFAYVGHYGVCTSGDAGAGGTSIFQIDLHSRQLARTLDLRPYNRIHGLQMDAQDRLYALSEEKAVVLVFEQPATDTVPARVLPSGGIKSHLFALRRDGQAAFCMNLLTHTVTRVSPWDPLAPILACHPGRKPEGCCLSEDERVLFVSNRLSNTLSAIDTGTLQVLYSAASRTDAARLYRHRHGRADARLVATNYGDASVSMIDPGTLAEVSCVPCGARPIALSFHPDKALAYVSLDDDRVAVFNLESAVFERFINTQREPDVSKVVML